MTIRHRVTYRVTYQDGTSETFYHVCRASTAEAAREELLARWRDPEMQVLVTGRIDSISIDVLRVTCHSARGEYAND